MALGVAELYQSSGASWTYVATGAACVFRNNDGFHLALINMDKASKFYDQKLYSGFVYKALKDQFHAFTGVEPSKDPRDRIMALNFADAADAKDFEKNMATALRKLETLVARPAESGAAMPAAAAANRAAPLPPPVKPQPPPPPGPAAPVVWFNLFFFLF